MQTQKRPGKFITLEGGDGSGKSTQSRLLAEFLQEKEIDTLLTREPGGAPGADEIRELILTGEPDRWDAIGETLLFYASRRNHLRLTIWPALDEGRWVISDRFADSTMAYQGYGNQLGEEAVQKIHDFAVGDFKPDLTFIFSLPVEEGLQRTMGRTHNEDRFEKMDLAFHERLRDGFQNIARQNPDRCVLIDATRSVEDIQQELRDILTARLLS
ncbi:dTMP kinase [Sneathiella sp. HT1-7]|jgi:dTMP kinase|uniref:dTMP kinase n=1 Tax=Sneathiella sp. HT1-7 TaxID=2887192 RepID=UPI001D150E37|nr:dTMP kinase [Sneathiella sp. HT1-7]MCC3306053.1 dTMP kinase [Sneathiella sp. HT1-7]